MPAADAEVRRRAACRLLHQASLIRRHGFRPLVGVDETNVSTVRVHSTQKAVVFLVDLARKWLSV